MRKRIFAMLVALIMAISLLPTTVLAANVTHTVTTAIDNGGTITETQSYNAGGNATITWSAAANYHVTRVLVDGEAVSANGSYTFTNIEADHSVNVETAIDTISVTIYTKTDGTPANKEEKLNVGDMKPNEHKLVVGKVYTTDPGVLFELDPDGSQWKVDNDEDNDGICRLVAFEKGTSEADVKAFLKTRAPSKDVEIEHENDGLFEEKEGVLVLVADTVFYQESDDYQKNEGKWEWVNSTDGWKNNQALFGDVIFTDNGKIENKPPVAPTENDLPNILRGNIVTVHCTNTEIDPKHADGTYGLQSGSYTIGAVEGNAANGYTCTVTVQGAPYVTKYNADNSGVTHTLTGAASKTVQLTWNGSAWTAPTAALTVTFTVSCPDPVVNKQITGFTKALVTEQSVPGDISKDGISFPGTDGKVEIPASGSVTLLYKLTVTGEDGAAYTITDTGATVVSGSLSGTLDSTGTAVIYVTRTFTAPDANGTLTNSATIAVGDNTTAPSNPNASATVPAVVKPNAPNEDTVKRLLGDKVVTVDCVNTEINPQHTDITYGLLPGGYEIGGVEGDAANGYTCEVTFYADVYQAKYNDDTTSKHILAPAGQTGSITLLYAPNADGTAWMWEVDSGSKVPVTFTVVCETPEEDPEKPTDEDLSNILRGSFVTVDCISTNAHSPKSLSYGLLLGGYTIGEVKDNAEDGYTCEVTFYADVYQAKYNDDTTSKHELYPQEQQPVSIVLTWNGEKWTAPDGYPVRFTVTCDGDSSYYTVTYTDGVDGVVVFADQTYYVRAGEKTPAFVGTPTRPGYRFVGWAHEVTETVTGSVIYTAQWRRSYHPTTPAETKPKLNKADHYAYVVGYPDGTVQPQGAITRAEVATIFFRLLSDETRDLYWTKDNAYTDIKAGDWFNNAVSTLSNAGIINGYPDGTFRPNAPITRAEMAKVIAMFAELDKDSEGFKDIAGHWAEAYIKLAAGNGWIAGYPDGTFRPNQYITRAETMTMINRVLERVPSEEEHLLSRRVMLTFPDNQPGDWYYIAVQEATNSHTYERYATEKNGDEQWIKLIDNYDWTKLEF